MIHWISCGGYHLGKWFQRNKSHFEQRGLAKHDKYTRLGFFSIGFGRSSGYCWKRSLYPDGKNRRAYTKELHGAAKLFARSHRYSFRAGHFWGYPGVCCPLFNSMWRFCGHNPYVAHLCHKNCMRRFYTTVLYRSISISNFEVISKFNPTHQIDRSIRSRSEMNFAVKFLSLQS